MIETAILYVADKILSQIIKDTWKNRVTDFFNPQNTYKNELAKVINETITTYEIRHPEKGNSVQFPFYKSQIIFEKLSLYTLFNYETPEDIDRELKKNPNVIIPSSEEVNEFYQLFFSLVQRNDNLKPLFIEENYKKLIFENTNQLKSIYSLTTSIKDDTDAIRAALGNYKATPPKELTSIFPKIKQSEIIGRSKDLEDIKNRLFDDKQVVLMNGMGGIGKTTLAAVFATQYYDLYHHILWVTSSYENFVNDLISTQGLMEALALEHRGTTEETYHSILLALKNLPGLCLLIIDNAKENIEPFVSHLPSYPNWHVLVTSRETISGFDIKELDFLNEENAGKLFKKYYTRKSISDDFIKTLVKNIEYHTLTIEIFAKTAQELNLSQHNLNNTVMDAETEISTRHSITRIGKVKDYLSSIFDLSRLTENELTVLKYFTLLPVDFIQYSMVEEALSFIESGLRHTLLKLSKRGWLLYNLEKDAYKVHQIITDVMKSKFQYDEPFIAPLIKKIASLLSVDASKDNPIDKLKWVVYGSVLVKGLGENETYNSNALLNNLALRLKDLGDYGGAKVLLEKAMKSDEQNFGEHHPTTAVRYSNLAVVLQDLGDYGGAKVLLEKAMKSDEQNFGEHHPTTAVRYSNLAVVLQDLGDYGGAKVLLEKSYSILVVALGVKHPYCITVKNNLKFLNKNF